MDKSYQIPSGFVNRKMLREQANISEHDLKSLEGQGLVKASRRNNFGWRLYSTSDVARVKKFGEELRAKREAVRESRSEPTRLSPSYEEPVVAYSLEQYRAVYTLIERGMPLDKIPLNVDIHPSIVTVIVKDSKHLAGAFMVAKSTVDAINQLALPGIGAIANPQDLLAALEKLADALETPPACDRCEKEAKKICLACAKALYRPKKKVSPAAIAHDDSERARANGADGNGTLSG